MKIPQFLLEFGSQSKSHRAWVDSLPVLIQQVVTKWNLQVGFPFIENATCSFVAPCTMAGKKNVVLKIGYPHFEATYEIEGLKRLNGMSVVRIVAADGSVNSMLLERCVPGDQLRTLAETEQDCIISRILSQIWSETNTPGLPHLSTMIDRWNSSTYERIASYPDPELALKGCDEMERLSSPSNSDVLLATDLHGGNVLKAERMEWLGIDIKPFVGDRTYDLTQHLLNCIERVKNNPRGTIERLAAMSGVDKNRLGRWMFARIATEHWLGHDQHIAYALA